MAKVEDRLMRVAVGLPVAVAIVVAIGAWAHGFAPQRVRAGVIIFFPSLVIARYFYLRAKDREAVFIVTHVSPTDPPSKKRSVDQVMLLIAAAFLVLVAAVSWR